MKLGTWFAYGALLALVGALVFERWQRAKPIETPRVAACGPALDVFEAMACRKVGR